MAEGTLAQVLAAERTWCVLHGDSARLLCDVPENVCDAAVIDPPSGIGFMGKDWDGDKGGMREWIQWLAVILERTMRTLKPGAHAFVWSLPRTSHWTGMALEFAGFEIRHVFQHQFGSGFPKSLSVEKAIDAKLGAERKVVGARTLTGTAALSTKDKGGTFSAGVASNGHTKEVPITEAATEEAKQWSGWGTAVKPAHEMWWLVRKPLERGLTVAENVLKWGTGAINIDAGRVGPVTDTRRTKGAGSGAFPNSDDNWVSHIAVGGQCDGGRWPADVVLSHCPGCVRLGTTEVPANPTWDTPNRDTAPSSFTGASVSKVRHANGRDGEASATKRYTDKGSTSFAATPGARRDATETVDKWSCVEGCPVRQLDEQSGELTSGTHMRRGKSMLGIMNDDGWEPPGCVTTGHDKSGTASRFFKQCGWHPELDDVSLFYYSAKPSRSERDSGLEHFKPRQPPKREPEPGEEVDEQPEPEENTKGARNTHSTVKGQDLLQYLLGLIAPPKSLVITPFAGSGSEGMAAVAKGHRFIGIELLDTDEEPHVSIARARISFMEGFEYTPRESLRTAKPPAQVGLFAAGGGE